jgi:hypothetical protein
VPSITYAHACLADFLDRQPLSSSSQRIFPPLKVLGCLLEPFSVLPTFVKCLEDVPELLLIQAVEVSHNSIQFLDHVLLLVVLQAATLDANHPRPLPVTIIASRQPSS